MSEELKSCPFCGETNLEVCYVPDIPGDVYVVQCADCFASGPHVETTGPHTEGGVSWIIIDPKWSNELRYASRPSTCENAAWRSLLDSSVIGLGDSYFEEVQKLKELGYRAIEVEITEVKPK